MTVTMYDSVDVAMIPKDAHAVAGYVGGRWPTFNSLLRFWPHAHHLSIAVNATEDAECLDVEQGDATPEEAPHWTMRQRRRGVHRPVLYASLSVMPAVVAALTRVGIHRHDVRLWSAHYDAGTPHIDPGCDGTQYYNHTLGRNLDVSLLRDDFFDPPDAQLRKWREELHHRRAQLRANPTHPGTRHFLRRRIKALETAIHRRVSHR